MGFRRSNRDQENLLLIRLSSIIYGRQDAKRWDTSEKPSFLNPFRISTSTSADSTPLQLPQNQRLQKPGRGSLLPAPEFCNSSLPFTPSAVGERRLAHALCMSAHQYHSGLRSPCFHTLTHSFASRNPSTLLPSIISALFCKNTPGGGTPLQPTTLRRSRNSQ
jgi:hypothetical protein